MKIITADTINRSIAYSFAMRCECGCSYLEFSVGYFSDDNECLYINYYGPIEKHKYPKNTRPTELIFKYSELTYILSQIEECVRTRDKRIVHDNYGYVLEFDPSRVDKDISMTMYISSEFYRKSKYSWSSIFTEGQIKEFIEEFKNLMKAYETNVRTKEGY